MDTFHSPRRGVRIALAVLAIVAALYLATHTHLYGVGNGALSSGAYLDLPAGHTAGIEWRGTPGLFVDVN